MWKIIMLSAITAMFCAFQVNNAEQYELSTESGFQETETEENSEFENQSAHRHDMTSDNGLKAKGNKNSGFR